jgi:hypothetical protein
MLPEIPALAQGFKFRFKLWKECAPSSITVSTDANDAVASKATTTTRHKVSRRCADFVLIARGRN